MQFTDGCWLMPEGVHASYAVEVRDMRVAEGRFTAFRARRHGDGGRGEVTLPGVLADGTTR
ncbi:hypothetical protein [Streptomyces sp. NPDC023327]|uniref:hypothetical protein n=1 Tax=Streptomyces sp. NPDC023327 TaxID=3157088 RepID=UPI0033DFBBA2